MAVIQTRPTEKDTILPDMLQYLNDLIDEYTQGFFSNAASGIQVKVGVHFDRKDPNEVLTVVHEVLDAQQTVATVLANDVVAANQSLEVATRALEHFIDKFTSVPYDEALDHATADLMDAFMSTGSVEVDDQGRLVFTEGTNLGRGDLKPILREAIHRWLDIKARS